MKGLDSARLTEALGYQARVRVLRTWWAATDPAIEVDAQLIVTGPGPGIDAPAAWGGRLTGVAGWSAGGIGAEADLELPDGRLAGVRLMRVEPDTASGVGSVAPEVVWIVGLGTAPFAEAIGEAEPTAPPGPLAVTASVASSTPVTGPQRPQRVERAWVRPVLVTCSVLLVTAIIVGLAGLGLSALGSIDVGTLSEAHDPDLPTTVPQRTAPPDVHNVESVNLRRGPSELTGFMSRIPRAGASRSCASPAARRWRIAAGATIAGRRSSGPT